MKLRKGSAEAKAYMRAIRSCKGRVSGGKLTIPKSLKKAGSKVGSALIDRGVNMALDRISGAGCMGGGYSRIHDPISGRFLKTTMKGSGFRSIGGGGFVPS